MTQYDHNFFFISGGFVEPVEPQYEKNQSKGPMPNAYAPPGVAAPPQQTVIVQNVQFGPRPVSNFHTYKHNHISIVKFCLVNLTNQPKLIKS